MTPRRGILLTLGLAFVIALPLAEVLYGRSAHGQYLELFDRVRETHPNGVGHAYELSHYTIGGVGEAWPSLFSDLRAWSTSRLGLPSDLGRNSSYLGLTIESAEDRPLDRDVHQFEWRPFRWTFVPAIIRCRQPGCEWAAQARSAQ